MAEPLRNGLNGNRWLAILPIFLSALSLIIVGLGVPVSQCMYHEMDVLKQTQSTFAPQLANYGIRLEHVERNNNLARESLRRIEVRMETLRGDIRLLGRNTGTDVSSTAADTQIPRDTGG